MFKNSKNVHNLKKMYISSTFVCHFSKKKSGISENVRVFQKFFKMCLFKIFTTVREMIGIQFFSCIIISFEIQSKFPFSYFSQKFQKMMVLCFCYKFFSQLQKCLLFFHLLSGVAKKIHVPKIVCVSIKIGIRKMLCFKKIFAFQSCWWFFKNVSVYYIFFQKSEKCLGFTQKSRFFFKKIFCVGRF